MKEKFRHSTKVLVLIWAIFLLLSANKCALAQVEWISLNAGISDLDFIAISLSQSSPDIMLAATSKELYLSKDQGSSWNKVFSLGAKDIAILDIALDTSVPQTLFVGTSNGLYLSNDFGLNWKRAINKASARANYINIIAQEGSNLYLGAKNGLYRSTTSAKTRIKADAGIPTAEVKALAINPHNSQMMVLANTRGLYRTLDAAISWHKLFTTSARVTLSEAMEEETFISDELINDIIFDCAHPGLIYISSTENILFSSDNGANWIKLSTFGLTSKGINSIALSGTGQSLFAATEKGIFKFNVEEDSWKNLYAGLPTQRIHTLASSWDNSYLLAGTAKGIYKSQYRENSPSLDSTSGYDDVIKHITRKEPTIQQLQEAALEYAQVIHPSRINSLRTTARLQAFLPDISLDYDKTIQAGGTGGNYGSFTIGPRDWGLSLSWDVGDLIYNEQIRLIDSNTRLMVQLREDILDEVTRLYYERRRLQAKLILTPVVEPEKKVNAVLRLQELTASIDALSGGYLTKSIKTNKGM